MPPRVLDRIRVAIRSGAYDMTAHAVDEMAEDSLSLFDVEAALLSGSIARTQRRDPRGTRYTVRGLAADGATAVSAVGRFTTTGRFLIITVYRVAETLL